MIKSQLRNRILVYVIRFDIYVEFAVRAQLAVFFRFILNDVNEQQAEIEKLEQGLREVSDKIFNVVLLQFYSSVNTHRSILINTNTG